MTIEQLCDVGPHCHPAITQHLSLQADAHGSDAAPAHSNAEAGLLACSSCRSMLVRGVSLRPLMFGHAPASSLCMQKLKVWLNVQVLLSICSLLTDPNPDDPLVPEIAHM